MVKDSFGFSDHKAMKFKNLRVRIKINNRITNLDLKRADLDLQKSEQALKKTSIDECWAPDLTLNTKRKYAQGESRARLLGRNDCPHIGKSQSSDGFETTNRGKG